MRCDDFICLGRTVPEESKKYGAKVCMAGISKEFGSLMRVYPLQVCNPIRVREKCVLELERNHLDTRKESWKLKGSNEGIVQVSEQAAFKNPLAVLEPHFFRSLDQLNDLRLSLGVLELKGSPRGYFKERAGTIDSHQGMLFEITDECFGANAIDIAPYIEFWDEDGKHHALQIREWGCYEWLRKHRDKAAQLWDNLELTADKRIIAVVGNQTNRRKSWLIIKTFAIPRSEQGTLFSPASDEEPVGSVIEPDVMSDASWRYHQSLKCDHWQLMRERILERDKHTCRDCGSTNRRLLQVHHLTYLRLGAERLEDLITLCDRCHEKRHKAACK